MTAAQIDLATSMLSGIIGLTIFGLFVLSDPKMGIWQNWHHMLRKGVWLTGAFFCWCAAVPGTIGHMSPAGVVGLVIIAYTLIVGLTSFAARQMPERWWQRLTWLEKMAPSHPDGSAILVSAKEAAQVASASGLPTVEPYDGLHSTAPSLMRAVRATPTHK